MLKVVCTKQDRMEKLMGEMNSKYENIVSMLAQMSSSKGDPKDKQVEVSGTPTQNSSGNLQGSDRLSGHTSGLRETKMGTKLPKVDFPYFGREGRSNPSGGG